MNSQVKLILIHTGQEEEGLPVALLKWVADVLAQRAEFEPRFINPAHCVATSDEVAVLQRREHLRHLAQADAFLIITPEQSHVSQGELKAFMDRVSTCWQAKPVAFIGYGGMSGGRFTIDQFRQVLAGQHAVPLCNCVSLANPLALIDEAGCLRQPDETRLAMARMLVQLNWWAKALKAAREQMPYVVMS
jgi:NAD(P)H-dependent FMN reductase